MFGSRLDRDEHRELMSLLKLRETINVKTRQRDQLNWEIMIHEKEYHERSQKYIKGGKDEQAT